MMAPNAYIMHVSAQAINTRRRAGRKEGRKL